MLGMKGINMRLDGWMVEQEMYNDPEQTEKRIQHANQQGAES